jgi:hypothetical protein
MIIAIVAVSGSIGVMVVGQRGRGKGFSIKGRGKGREIIRV